MRIEIEIDGGRRLPCAPSMGAMLRFRQETGKEVTEIDGRSLTELCTYLWCCVASACRREGVDFDMDLMEFADRVTPEGMSGWRDMIAGDPEEDSAAADGEKKSLRGSSTS